MIPPNLWPWRLIGKVVGAVVVLACLAWIISILKGWHDDSQALPGVKGERDAARAETALVRKGLNSEVIRLRVINEGLIGENEALRRQRAAVPTRVVRLCSAASEGTSRAPDPAGAGGDDAASTGAGPLPAEGRPDHPERPDIGADLYALFDEADQMLRGYRGLQAYVRGLPQACLAVP